MVLVFINYFFSALDSSEIILLHALLSLGSLSPVDLWVASGSAEVGRNANRFKRKRKEWGKRGFESKMKKALTGLLKIVIRHIC